MTKRLLGGMPDESETSQSPSLEGALAQPRGGGYPSLGQVNADD